VLDEPTELPGGTEVELVPVDDDVLPSGGDHLDDEERRRLHESIERGLEDVRAGRTVDAEQVIAKAPREGLGAVKCTTIWLRAALVARRQTVDGRDRGSWARSPWHTRVEERLSRSES
jgi:hypothetical protein